MADYGFNTDLGPKAQQGMSLGDMVQLAKGIQSYQQAEQLNPLAVRKATAETGTAELGLNEKQTGILYGLAGGVVNDPRMRSGKKEEVMSALQEAKQRASTYGIPQNVVDGVFGPLFQGATKAPEKMTDVLKNIIQTGIGATGQQELQTPQLTSNAAQQPILVNKIQGTVTPVSENGRNVVPTAADVALGSDYAKNLQGRSQAANDWLQRSTEMRGILDEFKAGAGSTTYAQIAQKLQAIGAPDDLVNKVGNGDLSATQSLQKFMASSIMSAARQSAEGSPFASEVKNFEANNPSVNSDPKTLKRFIDFYDRIAGASLKENEAMAQAKEKGLYNPGTWQADWQRIAQKEGVLPKTPSSKINEPPRQQKTIVREGTYNGKPVVQYSDGTIGYK